MSTSHDLNAPDAFAAPSVFDLRTSAEFEARALATFQHQAQHNAVYAAYLHFLKCAPAKVQSVDQIPFLPIETFKSHRVVTGAFEAEVVFTSSGTTADQAAQHHVRSVAHYREAYQRGFEQFYQQPSDWCIFALLPNYLEREGSSLVLMVDDLIAQSRLNCSDAGFFLYNHAALHAQLQAALATERKVLLLGVTYALLDFAEAFPCNLQGAVVMETGGMKGRRREMIRSEVHDLLATAFQVEHIHSEYGMTELMSQAYSAGEGKFFAPPWMRVSVRDTDDPLSPAPHGKTGRLCVIDLANIDSCAFLATSDLGRTYADGSFEVLGRFDQAEVRGCNLMI